MMDLMHKSIYTQNYKTLCEYLAQRRKKLGLTQTDLAIRIGSTRQLVSNYESGQRRIDIVEFCTICDALEIDAVAIFANWKASKNE